MHNEPVNTCSLPKINPAGIYLLKINNRNFKTRNEISPKLRVKRLEQILHIFVVFPSLTLNN